MLWVIIALFLVVIGYVIVEMFDDCGVYAPCGEFTLKGESEEKKINLCYGCYLKLFEKEEKE